MGTAVKMASSRLLQITRNGFVPRSVLSLQYRTTYKLVTNDPEPQTVEEIVDRAAQSIFWTELFRGFGVTLAHFFKEPATINYPFEKGPLSPRLVNMLSEGILLVKNVALLANYVKQSAQLRP